MEDRNFCQAKKTFSENEIHPKNVVIALLLLLLVLSLSSSLLLSSLLLLLSSSSLLQLMLLKQTTNADVPFSFERCTKVVIRVHIYPQALFNRRQRLLSCQLTLGQLRYEISSFAIAKILGEH